MLKSRELPPNDNVAIWIDRDIVEYYQAMGIEDWRERLNDTLRQAMRADIRTMMQSLST